MIILIVGSEYGSAASGQVKDNLDEYISITRKEFRTAIDAGIPVFAMIDKKVMAEYGIFEVNIEKIEKNDLAIQFKVVKELNVFRFIKEIKSTVNIPIQEFDKSSDIKEFIKKQWADMFKSYLVTLKEEKEKEQIESSVKDLQTLIQKMDIMLNSVGRNVLSKDDPQEYEDVINQQEIVSFCNTLINTYRIYLSIDLKTCNERKVFISKLLSCLIETQDHLDDFTYELYKAFNIFRVDCNSAYLRVLKNVLSMLTKEKNIEKIIETLSQDEFYNRLIYFEND